MPPYGEVRSATAKNSEITCQGKAGPDATRLIALYPSLRQTGWAVLESGARGFSSPPRVVASGVAALGTRRKLDPSIHIDGQLIDLNAVNDRWSPSTVVLSWAGGLAWREPSQHLLEEGFREWAGDLGLSILTYSASDVRSGLAGKANASKDALAYAVMQRLGLIGHNLTAAEWEAVAAGCHHLSLIAKEPQSSGRCG